MEAGLFGVQEDTSTLSNVFSACLAPWNFGWVSLREEFDSVTIDFDPSVSLLDCSFESTYMRNIQVIFSFH